MQSHICINITSNTLVLVHISQPILLCFFASLLFIYHLFHSHHCFMFICHWSLLLCLVWYHLVSTYDCRTDKLLSIVVTIGISSVHCSSSSLVWKSSLTHYSILLNSLKSYFTFLSTPSCFPTLWLRTSCIPLHSSRPLRLPSSLTFQTSLWTPDISFGLCLPCQVFAK